MEQFAEGESTREEIKNKLRQNFDGKIVRKDLTKKIKEGANVPVYVLEFLLGQYCSSDDEMVIEKGVQNVKRILADNFVRPDESQKILSQLRKNGSHTIIDMVTVRLDMKKDCFFAEFSNLGVGNVPIADEYPEKFDRLLCGGIWCIVQLDYEVEGDNNFGIEDIDGNPLRSKQKKQKDISPISIRKLTPIQMPHIDIDELKQGRKAFTKDEWLDILLRSVGMEPDEFTYREKWLLLTRMIPLVENNFNLCELGPRSTGKSHLYKEISPNSILISGGQTTVANLFYNMGRKTVGLVGLWDCVAFDEVAGIKFKDKDGIQIMKDYMASGSFARGKEEKAATASMVFVGNINQSVEVLLKTSSLFAPFPQEMGTDTAFLDRMHCYLPGWEIPKFRPEHFTNDYGFRLRPNESGVGEAALQKILYVDNCIVGADDYGSVMPHVLSNFVNIVTLNYQIGVLYVQNPPRRVLESLQSALDGDIEYKGSSYVELTRTVLKTIYQNLDNDVLGQDKCKKQILSGMYRLTTGTHGKPVVLMLYGPSGVGKTESAKSISKSLGGELLRIQFSMMQTEEAFNYVFGAEHSKSSFARDMVGRESNVILIDEFDKVNPAFYNAFYELFDEGRYVDTNYDIDLGQAVFLLTCNFGSETEIKKALGPAMFSRIGSCIEYADLTVEQKQIIINNWYSSILKTLQEDEKDFIQNTDVHEWFIKNAGRYDNIRILKGKMENAIFEKLTEQFIISK